MKSVGMSGGEKHGNETDSERMLEFIEKSPTSFHAAANMKELLKSRGYEELLESRPWSLVRGGKYFVSRNESALIAFQIRREISEVSRSWQVMTYSPCFRVKEEPEMEAGPYIRLNVEAYGGGIWSTWFDRPWAWPEGFWWKTAAGSATGWWIPGVPS